MEEDLYDIALEETKREKSAEPEEEKQEEKVDDEVPKDMKKYAMYVRKLVIGARKSIQKLEDENKELKENLKNSLNSSSVVTCPDCTHSFKERHHSIRPNHMKAFRANKCVELEFKSEEDMTTWLYLNQLETNSDGMPTVMKTESKEQQSSTLKSVGSKLPELNCRNKNRESENRKRRLESGKDEKDDAEKRIRIGIKKTGHDGKISIPSTSSSSSSSIRSRSEREKVKLGRSINLDEKRNHNASKHSMNSRDSSKSELRKRDSDDRKRPDKLSSHTSRDEKQERRSHDEKNRNSVERSHREYSRKRDTETRKERSPKPEYSKSSHSRNQLEIKPISEEIDKKFSTWISAKPKSPSRSPTPSSSHSSSRACRKPITFESENSEKNNTEPKKTSILSRISFTSKSAVRKLNIEKEEKHVFKKSPVKIEQQLKLQATAPAPAIKTNFKVPTKKTNEHAKKEEVISKVAENPVSSTAKFTMSKEKLLIKKESEQAKNELLNSTVSTILSNQSITNGTAEKEIVVNSVREVVDQAEDEQQDLSSTFSSESSFVLPVERVKNVEPPQNASQFLQHRVKDLQQKNLVPNSPNLLSEFFPDLGKHQSTAPKMEKKDQQEMEEDDDMSYWMSGDAVESEDDSDQEMEYEKQEEENVYPEGAPESRRSSMSSLTSDGKSEQDEAFSDCSTSQDANPRTPKMKTPDFMLDEVEVLDWGYDDEELARDYCAGNTSDDQIPITPNNGAVIPPQDLRLDDSGEVEDGECSSEEEIEEEDEEKEVMRTDELVHRRSISPTQKENRQKPKEVTNKNRGKRRYERMAESYSNGISTDQRAFGSRRN